MTDGSGRAVFKPPTGALLNRDAGATRGCASLFFFAVLTTGSLVSADLAGMVNR